jgi:AcrR family transcriptional regulator
MMATAKEEIQKGLMPLTARGEATRRKLLGAAEEEFGSKGFHTASVSSITTRAGVGQGTFYLYFHSKEEIFVNLVREIGHALRKQVAQTLSGVSDRLETERRMLESFFEFTQRNPGLYRIVQESQFVDEAVFREYHRLIAKAYADDLRAAAERGQLAPGDCETRAWAIAGMAHMIGMRWCLWEAQAPAGEVIDELISLIGRGMAPRSPG